MSDAWLEAFPSLEVLSPETRRYLSRARRITLPAGEALFREGDPCTHFLMVLSGTVRVQMLSEQGREIVLYRVAAGQTCVLTTACLLGDRAYNAQGVVETAVSALLLPASSFRKLLADSPAFRDFVFAAYGTRLSDLLLVVEEVAFRRIDARLAAFLVEHAGSRELAVTHRRLAVELGTAREVISRQLKELERRGWIRTSRGRITIVRPDALTDLAGTGRPSAP